MSQKNEANTMGLDSKSTEDEASEASMPSKHSSQLDDIEKDILDRVVHSGATFKSQQKGDPDLSLNEKREIALGVIRKSKALFLSKFGEYLKEEHLDYFANGDEDYEISYHTKRLKRYFDNSTRHIDVRNRRYQALKTLVEKGEYFSETEMMRRNPLLYDNLIGQYLSEDERKKRDNIDTTNITFVNLLLESIERDRQKNVKKSQLDAEEQCFEENDSDDDTDENNDEKKETKNKRNDEIYSHWGEMPGSSNNSRDRQHREKLSMRTCKKNISSKERQVLREEFVTHMYENFLNGKDTEFDYSTVDDNEIYDNIHIQNQDEEEKYFDSESPETVLMENVRDGNASEDELDIYMRALKAESSANQLTTETPTLL